VTLSLLGLYVITELQVTLCNTYSAKTLTISIKV